jgi:hypothetical protein
MTDRAALLDYADELLDGAFGLGASGPRTAALLACCALEDWLDEQSADWCHAVPGYGPTTNSKLVVLGTRQGVEFGERAMQLWQALSRAVHHHAYELQPSVAEVKHLVGRVRALSVA